MAKLALELDESERALLQAALAGQLALEKEILDRHITDKLPETVEEFAAVTQTQQDRVAAVVGLLRKVGGS